MPSGNDLLYSYDFSGFDNSNAKESITDLSGNQNDLEHLVYLYDEPVNPPTDYAYSFALVGDILENKGLPLHQGHEGSIRYKGKWELIDFFMVSEDVRSSEMEVVRIPFLMTYDRKYPGEKPLRTYSGPRYLGGVSDHCPIIIKLSAS